MPNYYAVPPFVDFSGLGRLPDAYRAGQAARREDKLREAFAGGLPRASDGTLDFNAMIDTMARYDPKAAFDFASTLAKRDSMTPYEAARIGLEYAKMAQPPKLAPTDKKAIFDAEDATAQLSSTIETLSRAKEINDKIYTGWFASTRGAIGAKAPAWAQDFIPDKFADPERGKATQEWELLMAPEAIKQMSETLKGATTDFELRRFEALLADPSTPPETRKRVIDRMLTLAQRKLEIETERANSLREGTYYQPGGGVTFAPNTANQAPQYREGMTATNPQTGERLIFKNGGWVPLR